MVVIVAAALVALGAAVGRLRLALVPLVISVPLAFVSPGDDAGDYAGLIPFIVLLAGLGAASCLALGALVRRSLRHE
jgi:hypothetical protein